MSAFPRGERECECGACRRGFASVSAFDRHRYRFACAEPSSRGLVLKPSGLWALPGSRPDIAFATEGKAK